MRLINLTDYDTLVLRRIASAVERYQHGSMQRPGWKWLRIFITYAGARAPASWRSPDVLIRLPKLKGDEWVHLQRQKAGIESDPRPGFGPPLTSWVALYVTQQMGYNWSDSFTFNPRDRVPRLLPLKAIKPPRPKVDPRRQRYERVLILEKGWIRKLKLAQTKLRKLAKVKRYYERMLKEEGMTTKAKEVKV